MATSSIVPTAPFRPSEVSSPLPAAPFSSPVRLVPKDSVAMGKASRTGVTGIRMVVVCASGNLGSLRGGTGLLERPSFDQSQFDPLPQVHEGGDIGKLSDKKGLGSGDSYRVLLIDDLRHTEKLVEKALPQVVPSISVSEARKLFHESREIGVAVVIVTVKEHAEFYSQMMIGKGLRSAIEPEANIA